MRRVYLTAMGLLAMSALNMQAQTILEEDFETGATASAKTPLTRGEGWTTVDAYQGNDMRYNWYNYYSNADSDAGSIISG